MTLRLQVRALREAKGLTQAELAERAGVRRATISAMEADPPPSRVELAGLERIAAALGVEPPGLLIVRDAAKRGRKP